MTPQETPDANSVSTFKDDDEIAANEPVYTTWKDVIRHWPITTLCIVSNEFCERFSFYGMRTVLTLYLLNVLKFNDRLSTIFFNGFTVLCYFTPILGAVVADGYIGMFWTILLISLAYASGQIVLAVASIQDSLSSIHPWLDLLGLLIISIGTGGIKPCVAPFGANQFGSKQVRMLSLYFSMFYFSINAGSMISTFISPLMRSKSCLGEDSCYPLAFGIPAVLMITATVFFALGSCWYKKPPVKDNVFYSFFHTVFVALRNKFRSKKHHEHWMQYYLDTHKCYADRKCMDLKQATKNEDACEKILFVEDSRSMIRVLIMFLPVPMFWALYDQQGSVWTIQALQMDCRLWGNALLLPDQMQTLNAVLILLFIPIFQVVIYPLIAKCIDFTPLRKMVTGGVLAAGAFVVAGFVQIQVNKTLPVLPPAGSTFVSVMNSLENCALTVRAVGYTDIAPKNVPSNTSLYDDESLDIHEMFRLRSGKTEFQFNYTGNCIKSLPSSASFMLASQKIQVIVLNEYGVFLSNIKAKKPTDGNGEFGLMIQLALATNYTQNLALCSDNQAHFDAAHPCDPTADSDFVYWQRDYNDHQDDLIGTTTYINGNQKAVTTRVSSEYAYKAVRPGRYTLYYMYNYTPKSIGRKTLSKYQIVVNSTGASLEIRKEGGVFLMVLTGNNSNQTQMHLFQAVPSNKITILWQIPQYVVITAAEILFSITGIELAYSQAAPSMKSVVQSFWLLTTSVGDLIIVLIALWDPFSDVAIEMFAYAGVMLLVMIIFALIAIFYFEYNYYTGNNDGYSDDDVKQSDTTSSIVNGSILKIKL